MTESPWSRLRAHYDKNLDELRPALVGTWECLAATYASTKASLCSADVEPARILLHRSHGYRDESHKNDVVALWFEHDPALAVAHLVAASSLLLEWNDGQFSIAPTSPSRRVERRPWFALRQLVKTATEDQRKAADKSARALAKSAPFVVRCALALAFPTLDLLDDEERHRGAYIPYGSDDFDTTVYVLACLGDSSHVDAVIDEYDTQPLAFPEILGDDAIGPMRASLLRYSDGARTKKIMAALTAISHPRCADACSRLLHEHHAMASAVKRLRRDPSQGIAALARWVGELEVAPKKQRARFIDAPREVLHALVRAYGDVAAELTKEVTGPALEALGSARDATTGLPEGARFKPFAALPWNLKGAKKKKGSATKAATKKKAKKPELLPYKERIVWGTDGPPDLSYHSGACSDEEMAGRIADSSYCSLMQATWMTADGARAILGEYEPKEWYAQEDDVAGMMHLVGFDALPAMLGVTRRLSQTLEGLRGVDSPRVAPSMAHAFANLKKVRDVGETWLLRWPQAAVVGLIPELFAKGKALKAAEAGLRLLAKKHRPLIDEVAEKYGDASVERVDDVFAQDTSPLAPSTKAPRIPAFCKPEMLPPPFYAGGKTQLGAEDMRDLVALLILAQPGENLAPLTDLKEACDAPSLARFSWSLFQQWLVQGAPMKTKWPFFALGHFGDAAAARELGRLAKSWAPGGFPSRAQLAIDVLASMKTDFGLLEIYKTAERVRSRALAGKAKQTLTRIAKERGLSMAELTDRLVPDLGLDDDGTTTLHYGEARSFHVRFDETLKPYLVAGDGKRIKALPKANKSDDEGMVAAAKAEWKMLKKEARSIASERLVQLERAMCSGRGWSKDEFFSFFVTHPLILNLTRRLVWRVENETSSLDFRCTADETFSDVDDDEIELSAGAIRLPHALEMDDAARAKWGGVFSDYELHPPFDQLSRQTFAPRAAVRHIETALESPLPTKTLFSLLRRGWSTGPSEQGGRVHFYERTLGGGTAALVFDPGIQLGDPDLEPTQKVELSARVGEEVVKVDELDPILLSEVARDLTPLSS